MKTQTAVEWLAKELESYGDPQNCEIMWEDLDSLVEQAKEMERAQRIDDYNNGHADREKSVFRLPTKNSNESI
jgi:hypothetical protein